LRVIFVAFVQVIVWEHWQWSMPDMAVAIILITLVMSIGYWAFERHLENNLRWLSSGHAVQRLTPMIPPRSLSFLPAVFTELRCGHDCRPLALSWYQRKISQRERQKNWWILCIGSVAIVSILFAAVLDTMHWHTIMAYENGVKIESLFYIAALGLLQLILCGRNCAVLIFQNEQKLKCILSSAFSGSEMEEIVNGDVGNMAAFDYSGSEQSLRSF